jgi:membrane-associated protease RseP (regulator of RpoE activity)
MMRFSYKRLSLLGFTGAWVLVLALAAVVFSTITPARAQSSDERGWLGVSLQDLDARLREAMDLDRDVRGALVNRVAPGSPADRAGIRDGDVITEFDGKRIRDVDDLMDVVRDRDAGDKVLVVVERDGKSRGLNAVLGSRNEAMENRDRGRVNKEVRDHLLREDDPRRAPRAGDLRADDLRGDDDPDEPGDAPDDDEDDDADGARRWTWHDKDGGKRVFEFHRGEGQHGPPDAPRVMRLRSGGFLGVQTMALEGQLAEYFEVSEGVLVTEVVEDSPAEKAGIKAGDVIIAVDGKGVETPGDLRRRVNGMDPEDTVELTLHRRGSRVTVTATLGDRKDSSAAPEPPRDRLVFAVPRIEGMELPDIEPIPGLDRLEIHGLDALKDLELPEIDWVPDIEFHGETLSKEEEARLREHLDRLRIKLDGLRDRLRIHKDEARERAREAREMGNEMRERIRGDVRVSGRSTI